ncbi:hypothetical protein BH20ACT6_BH20ACT6_20130 [soil metagenome]
MSVAVRVYRPLGALIVASLSGASLVVMIAVVAFALPDRARGDFTLAQDITLVLILAGALTVLYGIGRTQVRVDARGLHVVNGFRHHRLSWAQAVRVSLARGAPWAVLDTAAGDTVQLMGIQRSDGARATRAVRELRAAIDAHGAAGGDGVS